MDDKPTDTKPRFRVRVLTLFPEAFPGVLGLGLHGKALAAGLWTLEVYDLRQHGLGSHQSVDAPPYGGGAGMVLRPDVLAAALDALVPAPTPAPAPAPIPTTTPVRSPSAKAGATPDPSPNPAPAPIPAPSLALGDAARSPPPSPPTMDSQREPLLYLSPRAVPLTQAQVRRFASGAGLTLLCGRYEGIDQRFLDEYQVEEVSLGDFVLSGGEVAALALLEAVVRLLPGVLGNQASKADESFSQVRGGLLEYPQFTRPAEWRGRVVPAVLQGGNHKAIAEWRQAAAKKITAERRPDLLPQNQKQQGKKKQDKTT